MTTDADLIAAFLAKRSVTVVPTGARTMTNADMKRAIGYEPDTVRRVEQGARIASYDHLGRAVYVNELGEIVARDL